ncbi:hypothetical protein [Pontimicrobium sp. MEBiC01747]
MKHKLNVNIHTFYIVNIITIIILGLIATLLRGFTDINLIRYILFLNLINNSWYIIVNLHKLKLKLWTSVLFILVIISFIKGLVVSPISERSILDFYKPISFLIIYQIFSSLKRGDRDLIVNKIKTSYANFLLKSSIFFGITVVVLLIFFRGYPGLRLPLTIPLTVYALNIANMSVIGLIIVGIFSGKRAILVASLPVLILVIKKQLTVKKVIFFLVSVLLLLIVLYPKLDNINSSKAFNKYRYTIKKFEKFKETKDLELLNHASGQRLQEITSGFHDFNSLDYIFGKGVGYTYDLYNVKRTKLIKEDYGNIHFSPASLVLSYGLLFMLILYSSLILILIKARKYYKSRGDAFNVKVLYFIVLSFFIESLFAFILFVVPFLPICMGLLSNYIKTKNNDT